MILLHRLVDILKENFLEIAFPYFMRPLNVRTTSLCIEYWVDLVRASFNSSIHHSQYRNQYCLTLMRYFFCCFFFMKFIDNDLNFKAFLTLTSEVTINFKNFTRISFEFYFYLLYRTQEDEQTCFTFDRATLAESDHCNMKNYAELNLLAA